jgi:hypothetical protein
MFSLFKKDAFVQISCLLVVPALEMHACKRKLVFRFRRKTLMIVHELRFVPNLVCVCVCVCVCNTHFQHLIPFPSLPTINHVDKRSLLITVSLMSTGFDNVDNDC